MKHSQFSKKRLAVYISAILASGMGTQVFAEEAKAPDQVEPKEVTVPEQASTEKLDTDKAQDVEVIEVTGIRGSLVRSMNIKRNMSGVVDAISAEEMGKFPDTNLAEALQRITGVTVSRTNGEGSQITVRGFGPSFNLVTLNGRQMPGTGNSRSYDFSNLASDGVQDLIVHKTARAANPTGGLGATVNIVTGRPLDNPGEKISLSAKAIHDTSTVTGDNLTPEFSAVYSNTFADETLGFAFNVSHQERDFQQQNATMQGWQAQFNDALPDLDPSMVKDERDLDADGNRIANVYDRDGNRLGVSFFPRNMAYNVNNVERERTNAHAIVQYAPIDSLIVSLDWTGGKTLTGENSLGWGMWNEYGGNINAYEFDNNGTALYADITGSDGSFTATRVTTEVIEQSVGLNIDWQVSDNFSLAVDYHNSSIETDDGADSGLGSKGSLVVGSNDLDTKIYDYRTGDIPNAEILWNNGTSELAPSEVDSHFSQFTHAPGKSEVEQLQIDSVWTIDAYDIGLMEIQFGLARTEQTMSGSNSWSGLTGGFGFNPDYTAILPDGMFTRNDTSDFLNAFNGGGNDLNTNYYYTFDFDQLAAISENFLTNEELGGTDYFALGAYRDGTPSENSVTEETSSIYIDSLWEFDLGSFPVQINAGFRYEQTDVSSKVLQDVPTEVWWQGGSEWHTQKLAGESNFGEFEGEHDVFLPMIDMKVELSDQLVARASFSKTISRAPLDDLAGGLSLSGSPKIGSRIGSSGNTNLQPFESTNIDLGLTYYYAEGSYASIGYFNKDVDKFIINVSTETTIEGFNDIWQGPRWNKAVSDLEANGEQATSDAIFAQIQANGSALNSDGYLTPTSDDPLMVWNITRPENVGTTKKAYGIELALQHLIGETGFGFGINGTLVEGDVDVDVNDFYGDDQAALTGLSDSANAQVFYEKHGLSVKFTYAWRDAYYSGRGQDGGSAEDSPNFTKEYAQLDMSVNYDISDNFTVFFEGINLTNATEEGYGRYEEQFMFAREYGQRYALGMRYSFQ